MSTEVVRHVLKLALNWRSVLLTIVGMMTACIAAGPGAAQSVLTYHDDTLRTGWHSHEAVLNVTSVAGGHFNLLHSVPLDGQVDAQPLFVNKQTIAGQGVHHVVYVATSNDTVYAIDGLTGAILLSQHLGASVPQSALPGACFNNATSIGIDSTPVISVANNALYVITDTYESGRPVFRLHALALDTLQDLLPSTVITASHQLADGSLYTLNPNYSRQRPALLLSGSTIYAGFGSYCDFNADQSRGWLLGWNAQTLVPLAHNELTNQLATSPNRFFLSSIWMSGYGLATDKPKASVYFTTGNSDANGTTYNARTNLSESVLKVAPDLSSVQNHFTPANVVTLEQQDLDFGSGGALVLPVQPGLTPELLAAAGKDGQLYLVNRAHLNGPPLGAYAVGPCWCGPSYFTGSDGIGRIVTSGGSNVMTWLVETSPSAPASLTAGTATPITSGQDSGFFTSISSSGTLAGSAVIWAVSRPVDTNPADVTLYAIDPQTGNIIYSSVAGTWPNAAGNADIVPVVANGHVYVGSDQELAIFGIGSPQAPAAAESMQASRAAAVRASANILQLAPNEHAIYGTIVRFNQSVLTVRERTGALLQVDTGLARRNSTLTVPVVGRAVLAVGVFAPDGVMTASYLQRAKQSTAFWPADR